MKAWKEKVVSVHTTNECGTGAKITREIAKNNINIFTFYGHQDPSQNTASFELTTDNNSKASEAIRNLGYTPTEKEVVYMDLDHTPGAMAYATEKLGMANIDINTAYCTCHVTPTGSSKCLCVVDTNDNDKTVKTLS